MAEVGVCTKCSFVGLLLVLISVFVIFEYVVVKPNLYSAVPLPFRGRSTELSSYNKTGPLTDKQISQQIGKLPKMSTSSTKAIKTTQSLLPAALQVEHIISSINITSGDALNITQLNLEYKNRSVAMGCAITTRKIPSAKDMLHSLPFFKHLLPSFCKTASPGFLYMFYMGHDFNDPLLSAPAGRKIFNQFFKFVLDRDCKGHDMRVEHKFVRCDHSAKPAWAQNDALMAGYRDNMDYFYMVNDDTILATGQWTKTFIAKLASMSPVNVGLVGPQHSGGNTAILTYHFTHRTHINIFKYFYPRNFTDWYGDDWATRIYEPNNIKKMNNVKVKHTLEKGQRYKHHADPTRSKLKKVLAETRPILKRYLQSVGVDWDKWSKKH